MDDNNNNNRSPLSTLSDRLKSTSTQMSRLLSHHMNQAKDLFQTPTPESRLVDEATAPTLDSPDWGLNLRICSLINTQQISAAHVLTSIKKRFWFYADPESVKQVKLALELLEACAMNCEEVFPEIAAGKVVEDMVGSLIDNPGADRECRVRATELVRAWGESEDLSYLPVFRQAYENLKGRTMSSHMEEETFPATLESYIDQNPISPPESYPIPGTGASEANDVISSYNYGSMSAEQKKVFLEITKNSLEVLSSMLSSTSESKAMEDELTMSMVDKCKDSQPVLQSIVQSTTDDEGMLFEALNLNDELQNVLSKFEELPVSTQPNLQQSDELHNVLSKFEELPVSTQPNLQQSDEPMESSSSVVKTSTESVDVNKPTQAPQVQNKKSDLPNLRDEGSASGREKK